jgi:hypothetical protein
MRKIRTEKAAQYLPKPYITEKLEEGGMDRYEKRIKPEERRKQNIYDDSMSQEPLPVGRGKMILQPEREEMAHDDVGVSGRPPSRDYSAEKEQTILEDGGHRPGQYGERDQSKLDQEYKGADVLNTLGPDTDSRVVDLFTQYMKDKEANLGQQYSAYAGWDYSNVNHAGEQAGVDRHSTTMEGRLNEGLMQLVNEGALDNEAIPSMREKVDKLFQDKYWFPMHGKRSWEK